MRQRRKLFAKLREAKELLFFILLYFQCYSTFDLLEVLFDLHPSRAHPWMLILQIILEKSLGQKKAQIELKWESVGEFMRKFPSALEVIIDGIERPIQHPK
ncbi:MAG: transposase family protein [Trichodesmium sp. St2_bin6]|nr:transposase family protein [Trichodesmium sp. ALOHA_ZT_67]MDE5069562.1 transposase family protein [Trichodesmium sp. St4_bin8_1]MDE5073480.1 transposase family protein [Trichodesmium sp. St5_bin8]MDE5078966.1 transposase family protein [Trichodesmium sp. St2_bin6]MDE5094102.1 transposase family protein [Trichodesmium sp. St11_bin5]